MLRKAGFYAVANGWENGRHTAAWVAEHVEQSIPRRNERGVRLAKPVFKYFDELAGGDRG